MGAARRAAHEGGRTGLPARDLKSARMTRADRRRCGFLLGLALLAACAVPVPFARDVLFSTERAQLPEAQDCSRCHREVYEEWKDSPHAAAWRSESFARITADHTAAPCLDCHAPGPLGEIGRAHV